MAYTEQQINALLKAVEVFTKTASEICKNEGTDNAEPHMLRLPLTVRNNYIIDGFGMSILGLHSCVESAWGTAIMKLICDIVNHHPELTKIARLSLLTHEHTGSHRATLELVGIDATDPWDYLCSTFAGADKLACKLLVDEVHNQEGAGEK